MSGWAHQQDDDYAHEDALEIAQILHVLQQRRRAPKEGVLPRLLHCCTRTHNASVLPHRRNCARLYALSGSLTSALLQIMQRYPFIPWSALFWKPATCRLELRMPPLHFLGEHRQDKANQITPASTASSQGNAHLSRESPRAPPWPPSELRRCSSASPAVTPQSERSDPHQSFPPSPAPQQTALSCHAINPSAALCISNLSEILSSRILEKGERAGTLRPERKIQLGCMGTKSAITALLVHDGSQLLCLALIPATQSMPIRTTL